MSIQVYKGFEIDTDANYVTRHSEVVWFRVSDGCLQVRSLTGDSWIGPIREWCEANDRILENCCKVVVGDFIVRVPQYEVGKVYFFTDNDKYESLADARLASVDCTMDVLVAIHKEEESYPYETKYDCWKYCFPISEEELGGLV